MFNTIDKSWPVYLEYSVLSLIVVVAIVLRSAQLGTWDFGGDEILHIFAAKEIMAGNSPALPSGQSYDRAILFTKAVAISGNVFGLNEWTARLPSVIFGTLTVIIVFFVSRAWYTTTTGLISAFLIAAGPVEIDFSREVRMYAMLQCLYVLTIYFFFQGFEASKSWSLRWISGQNLGRWSEMLGINPILLVISGLLLLTTLSVHRLIIVSMSGPLAYVFGMACVSVFLYATRKTINLKYLVVVLITVLGALSTSLIFTDLTAHYLEMVTYVPTWAQDSADNWKLYFNFLQRDYPIMFATLGVASLIALLRNPRVTFYLVCCLTVPLILHSVVLAWKSYRYIFYLFPVIFILWSVGFSTVASYLYTSITSRLSGILGTTAAKCVAICLIAGVTLPMLANMPWFIQSSKTYVLGDLHSRRVVDHRNWKKAMTYVSALATRDDVIITSLPLLARYYGPNLPIYHLNNNLLDRILIDNLRDGEGRLLEYTAGAPVIMDLTSLQKIVKEHPSGWFVIERFRFLHDTPTPPKIREFVEEHFQLQDIPSIDDIMVWRWEDRPH